MAARANKIIATVLGCGSSGGVPRIGNNWGTCDPANPKNRRRRCSLLITGTREDRAGETHILIDTGCDLREQLLDAEVSELSAVFFTHEHADHTHGIDDLRVLATNAQRRVEVFFSDAAGVRIREAFRYCFASPYGSAYPPILNAHRIEAGDSVEVDGPGGAVNISAFLQAHGDINSLGFRVNDFAYSCDLSGIDNEWLTAVADLKVWIVDALRPTPHPSHLSLPESLELIARVKPGTAVLTNLHIDMDYATVESATPAHVHPAYDGMRIDVTNGKVLSD